MHLQAFVSVPQTLCRCSCTGACKNLCVSNICNICQGTPRITVVRGLACFTISMQHASLNQTPGRHLLARGASLQRAHRTFSTRPCAALDVRVPQATPQPQVEERKTYLGERFWQINPFRDGQQADYRDPGAKQTPPEICLKTLNHVALEAAYPLDLTNFYTRVLGFKSISRPDFPFEGSWLEGAGLLVHIIKEDPSVPKRIHDWKIEHVKKCTGLQEKYADKAPESWYIRRANHLAFEAEDSDAMEERLIHFGIGYTKAIVPGTDAAQLFFYDPEGHGVEVGCDYAKVADMLNSKSSTNEAAVAP